VRTTVHYVWLLDRNSWEPVIGTSRQNTHSRIYEYYLDINSQGRVIGGDWISSQRPDFLWLEKKATSFSGQFAKLRELLNETSDNVDPGETDIASGTETGTETEGEIHL
jgi:hypothetical protein